MSTTAVPLRMRERLDEYEGFHQTLGNELCHYIGIPSIIAGAATLLGLARVFAAGGVSVTLAELVAGAIAVFYVVSARALGVVTAILLGLLVMLGRALPLWAGLALFLGGWALQFVGHAAFEHRSPAFLRNLLHLLVGPAWIVERVLKRLGAVRPTPHPR